MRQIQERGLRVGRPQPLDLRAGFVVQNIERAHPFHRGFAIQVKPFHHLGNRIIGVQRRTGRNQHTQRTVTIRPRQLHQLPPVGKICGHVAGHEVVVGNDAVRGHGIGPRQGIVSRGYRPLVAAFQPRANGAVQITAPQSDAP